MLNKKFKRLAKFGHIFIVLSQFHALSKFSREERAFMASAPVHMHAKISACAADDTHKFRRRTQIKANCAWNARNSTCCIVLALSQCLQRVDGSSLCHLQMRR